MVAGIVHLRGYDLDEPRTRDAILASLLGEERVLKLIKSRDLPGTPMELAAAKVHDELAGHGDRQRGRLRADHPRRRQAAGHCRRSPGASWSAGSSVPATDAYVTWKVGRYVDREFLSRGR